MRKWRLITVMMTTGFVLAACGETEEQAQPEEVENVEVVEEDHGYQEWLDHARSQMADEQYDAAAGTLSQLLDEDLSDYPEVESEAEALLEEVHTALAEEARQVAGTSAEGSQYTEERQSTLMAEEYLAATGQEISEATDEEIEAWLASREEAAAEEVEEVAEEEEQEEQEESPRFATNAEAEEYAFTQTVERLNLSAENVFSFVNIQSEGWIQIEVRETHEADGVEWSTMKGIYRYNVETDELQVQDPLTGEFTTV
jgi:hypothetical protein